nr:phosphoribosyltransferase family protein [Planctomycetota bacterium]
RRRARGYDQARRIAAPVAGALGLRYAPCALRRIRHTAPQSGLAPSARRAGPRGAFRARRRHVEGHCVILVDDVLTSGATARACALALRAAGARTVTAAVACRAEPRSSA